MVIEAPYEYTRKKFSQQGLTVNAPRDSDFEGLVKMKMKIFEELSPGLFRWYSAHVDQLEKEFRGDKGQDPNKRLVYIVKNNYMDIVGSASLIQAFPDKQPEIGELTNIYLTKECRGKGLGEILVKDLIQKARRIGFEGLYLATRSEFKSAVGLYKKFGFKIAKEQRYPGNSSISLEMKLE